LGFEFDLNRKLNRNSNTGLTDFKFDFFDFPIDKKIPMIQKDLPIDQFD